MPGAVLLSTPWKSLERRLAESRAITDDLFGIVRAEALYDRPIPERHRIVFYIGHLEAFDWNLIAKGVFEREPFHAGFDKLFAFGIDPVDGQLPSDTPQDWPTMPQVRRYVDRVRRELDEMLGDFFEGKDRTNSKSGLLADGTLLNVAIEHRLMHAETLAYMLHQLPFEKKIPPVRKPSPAGRSFAPRMLDIPAGVATLGQPRSRHGQAVFGWDNEFGEHIDKVDAFSADGFPVTNGQFLEFVQAGGYEHSEFWKPDDWKWKKAAAIRHPVFWSKRGERFSYRTMFEEISLPLDWPVYVSHAEACAFARWAGKQLPTEAEWHRIAYGTVDGSEREYPWGSDAPQPKHGNFDFANWDPAPVSAHPAGRSAFGAEDLLGNGWEWTSSVFAPFAGFEAFPFYPGYSANFFDSQHFVMKGGSARTAACMLRRSFRNWFQTHYQYPYAGFRCVKRKERK